MSPRRPTTTGPAPNPVALSTASCYPDTAPAAFDAARRLGYDGVEVMVATDPVSQHPPTLARLAEHHGIPVLAVHAPCLLLTQRVWGTDPVAKLRRSVAAAELLGAPTVVLHPPLRWQRGYARVLREELRRIAEHSPVRVAMENMFPMRARGRAVNGFLPHWDVSEEDYTDLTLDLSHTATSHSDPLEMLDRMGDRLRHLHLADGSAQADRDEHLVPGRGVQPCDAVLRRLVREGFAGTVVVEISTRRVATSAAREVDLAASLTFARRHLRRRRVAPAGIASRPRRVRKRVSE